MLCYEHKTSSCNRVHEKHGWLLSLGLNFTMQSAGNNLPQNVKGDIQKLEIGFRKASFPLEKRELNIYNVSQRISTRVFNGKLPAGNGLEQMQDLLETTLGLQQIKV